MDDINNTLCGSFVSPTLSSFIYCLNSPLIYRSFNLPPPKAPQNQPSNPHHYAPVLTELQTRLHNHNLPSRATSTMYVRSRVLSPSTTLSSVGSVFRELVEKEKNLAIIWTGGIARKKCSAVRQLRSTMSIQEVFGPSFRTSR